MINSIRACLEKRLVALPALPHLVSENVKYDPDPQTPFVRCKTVIVTREPAGQGTDPMLRYLGFFRVLVCWPTGEGSGDAFALVDEIMNWFPPKTDLGPEDGVYVRLSETVPNAGYDDINLPFYCVPVTVSWYTFH